jgi:GNAT superfamily N-acetyltransferase
MSFEIIPALPSDSDEIAALVNAAYRGESARLGWTHEADILDGTRTDVDAIGGLLREPGHTILKYVEAGQIRGCVELHQQDDKLYLGMLTVRPIMQGKGIGKALLAAGEQYGKDLQCHSVYMTVISKRSELIDWYGRQGYRATGERKPFNFTDPRFGQPKTSLEFVVLQKMLQ